MKQKFLSMKKIFKFQSDSINTEITGHPISYKENSFKFQSDSINTPFTFLPAVLLIPLNSNLILLIRNITGCRRPG